MTRRDKESKNSIPLPTCRLWVETLRERLAKSALPAELSGTVQIIATGPNALPEYWVVRLGRRSGVVSRGWVAEAHTFVELHEPEVKRLLCGSEGASLPVSGDLALFDLLLGALEQQPLLSWLEVRR